jgi:arsenate reductase-like glutaredoxin family protein
VQKYGIDALVDRESRSYASLGMRHATLSEERWLERLAEEPLMLRMPLVRQIGPGAKGLTIGLAEDEWRQWTAS